jgi:hypothetical protein
MLLTAAIIHLGLKFVQRREELWHETARVALEKGQPVPGPHPEAERSQSADEERRNDFRAGLILIGVGAGLYLFFDALGTYPLRFVGAIPGFIGVALLLHAWLTRRSTPPTGQPPQS